MPLEITARAKIITDERGLYHLSVDNDAWWKGELSRFEPGTAVVISIKKFYKKRSLSQNSLFHAYVGILADYFGYSADTMKELIRLKWLKTPLITNDGSDMVDITTGEVLFELRSTTSLSTLEMAELCDAIREWSLDGWGVRLPLPEEQNELQFKKQIN